MNLDIFNAQRIRVARIRTKAEPNVRELRAAIHHAKIHRGSVDRLIPGVGRKRVWG